MKDLQVFFFPYMAQGHMIPMLDIAKLFASRGVKSTIITTPLNAHYFKKPVTKTENQFSQTEITVRIIKLPSVEAGLPENCENTDHLPSEEYIPKLFYASTMLKDQIEQLLEEYRPNCLVADMFFPWATDIAAKYKIPRLVFYGTSFFAMCGGESLMLYKPQMSVSSEDEPFILPNLPHEIKLTKMQILPDFRQVSETKSVTGLGMLLKEIRETELKSYGVIVNSFYELEPDYADYYRKVLERRVWHIGPVSLYNKEREDKARRGKKAVIDEHECLKWLSSKEPNSVIYVCFGSMSKFSDSQIYEIAMGLEDSEQNFVWVVRKGETNEEDEEENENKLPEGFEERMREKGLIIRGWAPQVMILEHEAVGGFLTHCGWNSTTEAVAAGVPMVTWPLFGEQFYNEKLVTDVLRIGVGVGAMEWQTGGESGGVGREKIAWAVKRVMVGEEREELRKRARGFKDMAKRAIEEGGSSYSDLNALIEELGSYQ